MTEWTPRLHLNKRFWVGCAVLLLGISFLIATALQSRDVRALARDGVPALALVIDSTERAPADNSGDSPTFHITYTFTANDQTITNERRVPDRFFQTHPIGTTWTLRVHPDDASLHDLYPGETKRNTWGFFAVSTFLIAIGAFFALSGAPLSAIRSRL